MIFQAALFGLANVLLSHFYLSVNVVETLWWNLMCFGTYLNLLLLCRSTPNTKDEKRQKYLSSLFVLSTTIRSIFPRIDVERICFFDSFLSTTIVGRSLATVGEVSFSLQISLGLLALMRDLNVQSPLTYIIPPAISIAQVLCWIGVLTTNQSFHCFEESIWAICMALLIPLLLKLLDKTKNDEMRYKLIGCTVVVILYVIYMVFIDVPMYYRRYAENEDLHIEYLSLTDGIEDAMSCKTITKSYEVWKEDSVWMIGYFTFCSLISVGLIKANSN